jgi:hypothetical protein
MDKLTKLRLDLEAALTKHDYDNRAKAIKPYGSYILLLTADEDWDAVKIQCALAHDKLSSQAKQVLDKILFPPTPWISKELRGINDAANQMLQNLLVVTGNEGYLTSTNPVDMQPQVNSDFPMTPGATVKNEPWHLFIKFGKNNSQKTHLGGFNTRQEAEAEIKALRPKAKAMFNAESVGKRFPFVFVVAEGPVAVAPTEEQYGGPWDKR